MWVLEMCMSVCEDMWKCEYVGMCGYVHKCVYVECVGICVSVCIWCFGVWFVYVCGMCECV